MTPKEIIEQFDEKFPEPLLLAIGGMEEVTIKNLQHNVGLAREELKSNLISTVISVLKEQVEEIPEPEAHLNPHVLYSQPGRAPSHLETARITRNKERSRLRLSLENKIKEWEAEIK